MNYPPIISPGDKVAIVAPAGRISKNDLERVIEIFQKWGLKVVIGSHVFDGHNFFSAKDEGRLSDLQRALDDESVRAVFCARGGYGTGRIIDRLDFKQFLTSPKWIIGFSDITLLHLKLHGLGYASLHGPVARQIGNSIDGESVESVRSALFKDDDILYDEESNRLNVEGKSSGQIVGGNLTLLCNNIGTSSDIDFDNKILFIEDIGERLYGVDRDLNQLNRSGRLKNLRGLIVGQFTNVKETTPPYGKSAYEIVLDYIKEYDFPVCFGIPVGHEKRNLAIPYSFECDLEVSEGITKIRFYRYSS
jgi:muramoyltetrapeptide carboxypeptidase